MENRLLSENMTAFTVIIDLCNSYTEDIFSSSDIDLYMYHLEF